MVQGRVVELAVGIVGVRGRERDLVDVSAGVRLGVVLCVRGVVSATG